MRRLLLMIMCVALLATVSVADPGRGVGDAQPAKSQPFAEYLGRQLGVRVESPWALPTDVFWRRADRQLADRIGPSYTRAPSAFPSYRGCPRLADLSRRELPPGVGNEPGGALDAFGDDLEVE